MKEKEDNFLLVLVLAAWKDLGTIGGILALLVSWEANHSVGWAIVHWVFNWLYLGYRFL